jgi:CubicO group peptidase (beta-lactamase class C family)
MTTRIDQKRRVLFIWITILILMFRMGLNADNKPKAYDEAIEKFRMFTINALKTHGIVGSTFVFLHDNNVLTMELYGLANIEQNREVDEETIYHWASITKTLTGIAIMQLRDRGLLKLDDPIIKYIPELRHVYNPFGDMGEITLRHLMSHSSGFRMATWPWKSKPWHPHEPMQWEQLVAMFPYTEILFAPGSKFSYSNPGIVFLGRVIELLTTDDWEVYIDKNIFKPLEMHRSYFDTTPYHLMTHKCQSYFLKEGKLSPALPDVNTGITVSNGGLKAPFPDFIKYLNFLMGDPQKQEIYDQILQRSSLEEMFRPQVEIPDFEKDFPGEGRNDAMALTFFIEDNFGRHYICHSGGQNAFVTHFYLNPSSRTAYVVGFNTLGEEKDQNTRVLDRTIKEYLFQNIFPLFKEVDQSTAVPD